MKCQVCGKQPASVHYTELSGNATVEYHLCEKCAQAKGLLKSGGGKIKFKVGDFLAGMAESPDPEAPGLSTLACGNCQTTYRQFKESGRLGCGDCYAFFAAQLRPLLRRIHGSTSHTGKRPAGGPSVGTPAAELLKLREQLKQALEREDFEQCAKLRDAIRKFETEGGSK